MEHKNMCTCTKKSFFERKTIGGGQTSPLSLWYDTVKDFRVTNDEKKQSMHYVTQWRVYGKSRVTYPEGGWVFFLKESWVDSTSGFDVSKNIPQSC